MKKILIALSILATVAVALAGYVIVKNVTNDNKEYEVFTVTSEELAKGEYHEYAEAAMDSTFEQSYLIQSDKGKIALDYGVRGDQERYFENHNYSLPSADVGQSGFHVDFNCDFVIVNLFQQKQPVSLQKSMHSLFKSDEDPFTLFKNHFTFVSTPEVPISSVDFYLAINPEEKIDDNLQSQLIVTAEEIAKGTYEEGTTYYGSSYQKQSYTLETSKGNIKYETVVNVSSGARYFETSNFKTQYSPSSPIVRFNFPAIVLVTYKEGYEEAVSVYEHDEDDYAYSINLVINRHLQSIRFILTK